MRVRNARKEGRLAFTIIELVSIIAVLILIAIVALSGCALAQRKSWRIACVNQLKDIGLGFRIFAMDNGDHFPAAVYQTNATWLSNLTSATYFRYLSNEISNPAILWCPADRQRVPAKSFALLRTSNISYFVGLSGSASKPQNLLAGDRNMLLDGKPVSGLVDLAKATNIQWSKEIHGDQGDVVMGDGSVQQFNSSRLAKTRETNLLLFP